MAKKASPLPEGFAPLDFERLAGYFARKQGNAIQGVYVGSFTPKSNGKFGPKKTYRIKVTTAGTAITSRDEKGKTVEAVANIGDIVGLDETGYTKKLNTVGEGQEVFLLCEGKKGPGQQDPWVFQIAVRQEA